jgi:hypothetical protein
MSPSRKAALAGIWIGSTAAIVGLLPIVIVIVFVVFFGHGPRHIPDSVPTGLVMLPMLAIFLTPIGLFFGIPGLLILAISIPIYIDAKRKETPPDLTRR